MSLNKVNIQVPEYMIDQLQSFMETLELKNGRNFNQLKTNQFEVMKVINHKLVKNKWVFMLQFADNSIEWVNDEDCNCEYIISNYLKSKTINCNTSYIICRVSTKEQAGSTHTSLEDQESEITNFVKKITNFKRIKVIKISKSAYKSIPEELQKIGEACKKDDGIFIWRIDRLSRNIVKYLSWLEDLNNRGVNIYSTSEDISYKKNKIDFIQSILDAQKEAQILGERVKLSNKRKRERGDQAIGSLPYGKKYRHITNEDGSTKRKIVINNEVEMQIIKEINVLKADNTGYSSKCSKKNANQLIADDLNKRRKFKRGRRWTSGMINNTK
jgi:DNA invertase Pin-like site-specific DNA recombinase